MDLHTISTALHPTDLQFIESLDTQHGTASDVNTEFYETLYRVLLPPSASTVSIGPIVQLFLELGKSAIPFYSHLRRDLFTVIHAHLSKIAYPGFLSGSIPSYITAELFSENNVNWMIQNGCFYTSMNNMTFLDIMCMIHTVIGTYDIRIHNKIIESNESYIRDALYELTNNEIIDFRIFHRNSYYFHCLLDTLDKMPDGWVEDATSITDYPVEVRDRLIAVLKTHLEYYITFVKLTFQMEYEYSELVREYMRTFGIDPSGIPVELSGIHRRQIRERILFITIMQSTLKRVTRQSIFTQAIGWMASRWIHTRCLQPDEYLGTDYSLQITGVTNMFQVIHRNRSNAYRIHEPYTVSLYHSDECIVLNTGINAENTGNIYAEDETDIIHYCHLHMWAFQYADLWNIVLDTGLTESGFNVHLKCQLAMSISPVMWLYIHRRITDKAQLYKNMIRTYIFLENYGEHTGFNEQLDFRNFIVSMLLACGIDIGSPNIIPVEHDVFHWLESMYSEMPHEGLQFMVMANRHIARLVDAYDTVISKVHRIDRYVDDTGMFNAMIYASSDKMRTITRFINLHILTINAMTSSLSLPKTTQTLQSDSITEYRWWVYAMFDTAMSITNKIVQCEHAKDWYSDKIVSKPEFMIPMRHLLRSIEYIMTTVQCIFVTIPMSDDREVHTILTSHPDTDDWFVTLSRLVENTKTKIPYDVSDVHRQIHADITKIDDMIKAIHEIYNKSLPKYSEEVPGDFIDGILCCEIHFPIELPDTHTIVDDWGIVKHVLIEQTDPYTRKSLTLSSLLEYQQRDDVIARVQAYRMKWHQWVDDHTAEADTEADEVTDADTEEDTDADSDSESESETCSG